MVLTQAKTIVGFLHTAEFCRAWSWPDGAIEDVRSSSTVVFVVQTCETGGCCNPGNPLLLVEVFLVEEKIRCQ